MNRRLLVSGVVGVLVVLFVILFISDKFAEKKYIKPYFPDEPEAWLETYTEFGPSDYTTIDIDRMTKGKAFVDDRHQRYAVDGEINSFYFHGYYNGNYFYQSYTEPTYYNETYKLYMSGDLSFESERELELKYTKMKISNTMDPDDGIIEGLIAARYENGKFVFYIFLDEDWKEQVPFTNIVWGDDWTSRATMHQQPFDFSMKEKGVYIDKIEDSGWLDYDPIMGGVIVGKMTINDVLEDNTKSTFIYTR